MRTQLASWLAVGAGIGALLFAMPDIDTAQAKPSKKAAAKKKQKTAKKRGPKRYKKCPFNMVTVRDGRFCIDRYEAYVGIMLKGGKTRRHSPFKPIDAKTTNIKALNKKGRMPQAYISQRQAKLACENAGKRLCSDQEWVKACQGKRPTTWPYGKEHEPKRCNDRGFSSFNKYFGEGGREAPQSAYTFKHLNDPRLNKPKGTCAPSGRFKKCKNSYKAYDMVGNLHEWTSAPGGTFRGGFFLDVHKHGDGCTYKTTAHSTKYHDYSTGFRCCATLR
jgi:sulfatase modifying factor 1